LQRVLPLKLEAVFGLGLCFQVTGSGGDTLGVAERSNGILCMESALPLMESCSPAEPRVNAAVAASLAGHQDTAATAADPTRCIVERTLSIRRDIATAQAWCEAVAKSK
jgi:hypothetical protein